MKKDPLIKEIFLLGDDSRTGFLNGEVVVVKLGI